MRIDHGPEHGTLTLRSSTKGFGAWLGLAIGVFGASIGTAVIGMALAGGALAEIGHLAWLFLLHPMIFLTVGFGIFGASKKVSATLRPYGESEAHFRRWYGIQRRDDTFTAHQVRVVRLHTEVRISRSRNGSRRDLVTFMSLGLQDGGEILIGVNRRGSFFQREQALVEEAGRVAEFLGVPVERSGHGAPQGWGPDAGWNPGQSGHPGQHAPYGYHSGSDQPDQSGWSQAQRQGWYRSGQRQDQQQGQRQGWRQGRQGRRGPEDPPQTPEGYRDPYDLGR
ncbi:hypothetical protein Q7C18_06230 [Nesterenkonia sp. CL21]|uniref:hypothetical protein n=1 Tax=Nesterenkonia sp. CL21 TaxID=3064894 RepID=UPI00287A955E|nr:hypothetical protein [Nesterenkonia sp. CL21]MDS2172287.1 hypothetical protein [Nesterenkonia sp. CL21]